MPNAYVEFFAEPGQTLTAYLSGSGAIVGTPAASYAVSESDPGLYQFVVDSALAGLFYLKANDGAGDLAYRGLLRLTGRQETHFAGDPTPVSEPIRVAVEELTKVIKSGEAFTASGPYETPREVTFTRNE